MAEWIYKERMFLKLYMLVIFLCGEAFLMWVFFLLLEGYLSNDPSVDPSGIPFVLLFFIVWNIFYLYMIFNSPQAMILTVEGLKVIWRKNRQKIYSWQDIELKTIGLNPTPIIVINDESWQILNFRIPRMVVLNGFSKKYKEMIIRIKCLKPS